MEWLCVAVLMLSCCSVWCQDPIVQIRQTSPPTIRPHNKIQVKRDKDVTMDCYVENLPENTKVRWQMSYYDRSDRLITMPVSQNLGVSDNTKHSMEKPTHQTWRLRIKNSQAKDTGNYTCYVSTAGMGQIRVFDMRTVEVLVPPVLIEAKTSSDTVVNEGEYVELMCHALGMPKPLIEWSRVGNALLPSGHGLRYNNEKLTMQRVRAEDRGEYRCSASNIIGEKTITITRIIHLEVKFKPKVTSMVSKLYQAVGYLIELQCLVIANPLPDESEITWILGPMSISRTSRRIEVHTVKGAFNILTYELIIHGVREEDYGVYTCRAKNSQGISTSTVELIQSDKPFASVKLGKVVASSTTLMVSIATTLMCLLVAVLHL